MKNNVSRNNHYLSQMYLQAWKNDMNKVEVYELLVPNEKVPIWQPKSLKSIGSLDSIFVRFKEGKELDDIEKWFNDKYETPAKKALEHAINDELMTNDELHSLIDFLACHIVRSPAFIIKTLDSKDEFNNLFQETMNKISKMTKEELIERQESLKTVSYSNELFPFKLTNLGEFDKQNDLLLAETVIGKQFYLWKAKYLLENTSKVLHKHNWSILTVDENVILPTSDDPVIRLNYYENSYDFEGGWGKKNCNIIFPISPKKILFTQIGLKTKKKIKLDYQTSLLFKKMIIEHSYRRIISSFKDDYVGKIKPRDVDETKFKSEIEMWKNFQKRYLEEETEYIR